MTFVFIFIGSIFLLDTAWWIVAARMAKSSRWQFAVVGFMALQMFGLCWLLTGRILRTDWDRFLPKFLSSAIFLWHFIGLPLMILGTTAIAFLLLVLSVSRFIFQRRPAQREIVSGNRSSYNRREFLALSASTVPPLLTGGLAGIATVQLNRFRVRRFVLPIPGLPRDLDGMTIAHVSDIHVGRFTSGRVLREMVDTTNNLRADLVLLTGDLINDALADLPEGLDLVKAMHGRFGLCMIEGNHDLIEDGQEFERRARASGIPFLLDESTTLTVRGFPIQLFGLRWVHSAPKRRDEAISDSVVELLKPRDPSAFPILLAHHPHAFDAAANLGLPLTLSGHTHGGQIMLNERTGFGPGLFRYWSGLYTIGHSRMIVSNGVGNWFPLRMNAPAEIVHITLTRSSA